MFIIQVERPNGKWYDFKNRAKYDLARGDAYIKMIESGLSHRIIIRVERTLMQFLKSNLKLKLKKRKKVIK